MGWAGKVCCIHQHAAAALAAFGDDGEWSGVEWALWKSGDANWSEG